MPGRGEKDLRENVGGMDRFMRVGGGAVLLGLSVFKLTGTEHLLFGFIGIYGIITGTFRICLFNRLMGISTAQKR